MSEKQPMVAVVGDLVHGFTFFGPINEDDRDTALAIAWLEANEDVLIVPLRPLPPVEDLEAGRVGRTATNA